MAEYIKRETLVEWLRNESDKYNMKDVAPVGWTLIGLINELHKIPTADVVERKHGKWIWQLADNGWADNICSVCGYTINDDVHVHVDYNFCPNCGADMRIYNAEN